MNDTAQKTNFLESEALYKLIYEISPEAIIIVDKNGNFIKVNDRVYEWLGFDDTDIIGKHFMDSPIFPTSSKTKVLKVFTKRMMGKDIPPYELEFNTKDSATKVGLIRATPIKNTNGEIVGDLVMVTDITNQKDNQKQYEAILRTSPDAITVTDLNGIVTFVSKQTLALHGFDSPEEMLGRNILDLLAEDERERATRSMKQTLEKGEVENATYKLIKKDGSFFYGEINASVISDLSGSPTAFISIIRDVTEKIKSEKKLMEKSKELERLNKHMVGREIRMAELKEDIKYLKEKLNGKA